MTADATAGASAGGHQTDEDREIVVVYAESVWAWSDPGLTARPDDPTGDDPDRDTNGDRAARGLVGYDVRATDGGIGSIDEAGTQAGASYLVVDAGAWIFGRKVLLPAALVQGVDHTERTVYLHRTKDEIMNSPEYDPDTFGTPEYRRRVGSYYEGLYRVHGPF